MFWRNGFAQRRRSHTCGAWLRGGTQAAGDPGTAAVTHRSPLQEAALDLGPPASGIRFPDAAWFDDKWGLSLDLWLRPGHTVARLVRPAFSGAVYSVVAAWMPSTLANPAMPARCFSIEAANSAAEPGDTTCPVAVSRSTMVGSASAAVTSAAMRSRSANGVSRVPNRPRGRRRSAPGSPPARRWARRAEWRSARLPYRGDIDPSGERRRTMA